jgi:hypothetical protein
MIKRLAIVVSFPLIVLGMFLYIFSAVIHDLVCWIVYGGEEK